MQHMLTLRQTHGHNNKSGVRRGCFKKKIVQMGCAIFEAWIITRIEGNKIRKAV